MISTASLTATASQVLAKAASPLDRGWLLIQNTGEKDAFLKFDGSATEVTAANGYKLAAGETITLSNERDSVNPASGWLPSASNEIRGICTAAETTTLRIQSANWE